MRLTEDKFMINEYSKHRRTPHLASSDSAEQVIASQDLDFAPKGLRLGTLLDIHSRSKNCPLCRLVTRSIAEQPHKKPLKKDEKDNEIPIEEQDISDWPEIEASCFASWQVDGRLLKYDREGKLSGSAACTRRIRIHWDWEDFFDTYIVLMASPSREAPGLFLGRTIISTRIDPAALRQWTEFCVDNHGPACHGNPHDFSTWKSFFGVIDVKKMCLTPLPPNGRYVALSYVWGGVSNFKTNEKNIKSFMRDGGLRQVRGDLPRTIRDSIDLVGAIGERYLWVDALCIVQGSKRSFTLNSRVMDMVYGNAYLTICAADGQDANAGLMALHSNLPPPTQIIERYNPEVRLMSTVPAETYVRQSKWNQRAWTFQERLLSKRNLIFVGGRVYFQCRYTARSNDIITEDKSAGWSIEFIESPMLMLQQLPSDPLTVYKRSLELYMTRELSFSKDVLAAFNGIGNLVCEALGGGLIFGFPSSHFDWALLWEARDAPERRVDEDEETFPSWSWCGWTKEMMEYKPHILSGCEENLHEWLMHHTWITWYIRDFNGNLRLVWDGCDGTQRRPREISKRGYDTTKIKEPHVIDENGRPVYDEYGRYIKEDERDLVRTEFRLTLSECPYGVNVIPGGSCQKASVFPENNPRKDLPYLQFHTWSAFFRIRDEPQQDFNRKFQRYSVLDYKDDWCGTIVLERRWAETLDMDKPLEFIAISDAKHFDKSEYDGWTYYIEKERNQSAWDLYYVLLIEYRLDMLMEYRLEIASRMGLGKVFKDAFNNSCKLEGKQWKEFIMG